MSLRIVRLRNSRAALALRAALKNRVAFVSSQRETRKAQSFYRVKFLADFIRRVT
jgi:hypothetical protein